MALSVLEQRHEPLQVKRPAALSTHPVAHRLPARAMALEIAVFELDARLAEALGDKADFHLAGLRRIRLDLPARVDVPADHDAIGRLVRQHARPAALRPVNAAVINMSAD